MMKWIIVLAALTLVGCSMAPMTFNDGQRLTQHLLDGQSQIMVQVGGDESKISEIKDAVEDTKSSMELLMNGILITLIGGGGAGIGRMTKKNGTTPIPT